MRGVLSSPMSPMHAETGKVRKQTEAAGSGVERRALLAAGAVLAAGLGAGVQALAHGGHEGAAPHPAAPPPGPAPLFHGPRQAGVTTPPQPATQLLAFDLAPATTAGGRDALRGLLADLTRLLAAATAGRLAGPAAPGRRTGPAHQPGGRRPRPRRPARPERPDRAR